MGNYFADRHLKEAFTFQDMYLGDSPFAAPATYSFLQYTELADGVWFPKGGLYRVVQALASIAEDEDVCFEYDAAVRQINIAGRRATGVTLADGRRIQADVVVANADLPYVYRALLPDDGAADRLERKQYSCSTLTFYWGLDRPVPQLGVHNLFLAGDYRRSFDRIMQDKLLPDEPSFYVHAPARADPGLAPEGQDSLMVLAPVGHVDDKVSQDWSAIRKQARAAVLHRLSKIGAAELDKHIKFEVSYGPADWQDRYNLYRGASHGLRHVFPQLGGLRPRNRHARYRNLYFVGGSTHPGNGLPLALLSARLTTERILKEARAPRREPAPTPVRTQGTAEVLGD